MAQHRVVLACLFELGSMCLFSGYKFRRQPVTLLAEYWGSFQRYIEISPSFNLCIGRASEVDTS